MITINSKVVRVIGVNIGTISDQSPGNGVLWMVQCFNLVIGPGGGIIVQEIATSKIIRR